MTINSSNTQAIDDFYFHDAVFDGFNYDYARRAMKLELDHKWAKKHYSLIFRNVVAFNMQSCAFWGMGNAIYHMCIDTSPIYFDQLIDSQRANSDRYRFSFLDQGISYISLEITLNSGDVFRITCEELEITERIAC